MARNCCLLVLSAVVLLGGLAVATPRPSEAKHAFETTRPTDGRWYALEEADAGTPTWIIPRATRDYGPASQPRSEVADVVFIIDGSKSILGGTSRERFTLQKQGICNSLCGPDAFIQANGSTAIAVIKFSDIAVVAIALTVVDTPSTAALLCADIEAIEPIGKDTNLTPALNTAAAIFSAGAGSTRCLILSSDAGLTGDVTGALAKCGYLRQLKPPVRICTVLIGVSCANGGISEAFMKNCANTPDAPEYDPGQIEGRYACADGPDALQDYLLLCEECGCRLIHEGGPDCNANGTPDACEGRCLCPGDLNRDCLVDFNDIGPIDWDPQKPIPPGFVCCLLNCCTDPLMNCRCADFNGDGNVNGLDIPGFVRALVDGPSCPEVGACCLPDRSCRVMAQPACEAAEGDFAGGGTICECGLCPAACCHGQGQCDMWPLAECNTRNGSWYSNKVCGSQVNCAPPYLNNDLCENAIALSGTCLSVGFNTSNATYTDGSVEGDPPSCLEWPLEARMVNDIWYKYQIPTEYDGHAVSNGIVVVSTLGSSYDTVLVAYGNEDDATACPAGINCPVSQDQEVHILGSTIDRACSDDIEGGINQASYVQINVTGDNDTMDVGGCLLIRVGGLNRPDRPCDPHGGIGVLNIDFYPTSGDGPWDSSYGVCCLYDGTCTYTSETDCIGYSFPEGAIGYFRPKTDFYEYLAAYDPNNAGDPAEGLAHYCCPAHGEWGSCQVGEYCGNPIKLSPPPLYTPFDGTWDAFDVRRVTYFSFRTRPLGGTETAYAITLDTCGSAFNTVLSVYKGWESVGGATGFSSSGECLEGNFIKRNNECTLAGGAGDCLNKVSCFGNNSAGESCMRLTVGQDETSWQLKAGDIYYVAVGKYEASSGRQMGVDPAPNYPIDPPEKVDLKLTIKQPTGHISCESR